MTQEYNFIADIIDSNWFQEVSEEKPRKWTFFDRIQKLSDYQLQLLVELFLESIGQNIPNYEELHNICNNIKNDGNDKINDILISIDLLAKYLLCLTVIEYRFDSIGYYPGDLRGKIFKRYSNDIGMPVETFMKIFQNWYSKIREKIYSSV